MMKLAAAATKLTLFGDARELNISLKGWAMSYIVVIAKCTGEITIILMAYNNYIYLYIYE